MLFHILRHIQPQHGIRASVDLCGQRPAQLGLPYTGWPGKKQTGNGAASVTDAGKTSPHRLRHGFHRPGLAHDVGRQQSFQIQQAFSLPCRQTAHRNPCPGGDYPGNIRRRHRPGPLAVRGTLHQILDLIPQLCRPLKPPLPHRLPQFLLQFFPGRGTTGAGRLLHFCPGRALIQQVDGLIRQVQVRKIPDGQPHCLPHGLFRDPQSVVAFQAGLQRPENFQRRLPIRLLHAYRAKSPLQGGILFNIFPVLLPGSGSHHLQLSPAQGRFQNIGGINGPLRRAGPDNGMHFVHKENHVPAAPDLRQHIPQPLLKFPPVLGTRHQACHIQAVEALFF